MKYSVIVPVYKVETYLPQCVESVLNQTFADLELILVDDGSPDHCGALCDAYAERDARVQVVHQLNKGLPGARNSGIAKAHGEWLLFLDSDDYMQLDFLAKLAKKMDDYPGFEVYIGTFLCLSGTDASVPMSGQKQFVEGPGPEGNLKKRFLHCYHMAEVCAWKMAVHASWLQQTRLRFAQDVRYAEDVVWSLQLFQLAPPVCYVDIPFVVYRMARAGSITNAETYPPKNLEMRILAWQKFRKGGQYKTQRADNIFAESFAANKVVGEFQAQIKFGKAEQKQEAVTLMKENEDVVRAVKYSQAGGKRYAVAVLLRILGPGVMAETLQWWYKQGRKNG